MPWYALPYADRDRKNKLSGKFKVQGIPSLVVLEVNGTLITDQGRMAVMKDPVGANFPWKPKSALETLNQGKFVSNDGKIKTLVDLSKDCDALGIYFSASWCGPCHRFSKFEL